LSREELLEALIRTMEHDGIVTDTFDGKLWLLLVEKATWIVNAKLYKNYLAKERVLNSTGVK